MNRYEEIIKDMNVEWRHFSRNNYYLFNTSTGTKNIIQMIKEYDVNSVLDYGCGHNDLSYTLANTFDNIEFVSYDPGVPHFSKRPSPKEMTICYNVLQIIEPGDIDNIIEDLHNLTSKYLLVNISLGGIFQRNYEYYVNLFEKYSSLFVILDKHRQSNEYSVCRKNLDKNEIFFDRKYLIETGFFLLKIRNT
jgi:hypothetical protein